MNVVELLAMPLKIFFHPIKTNQANFFNTLMYYANLIVLVLMIFVHKVEKFGKNEKWDREIYFII
jgi:hypothetical protein